MAALALVIILLSFVQSLFGVGLLVFGTPTLLLMGYSFDSALAILLPSSITVNCLQLINERALIQREFFYKSWPLFFSIVIGLVFVLLLELKIKMSFFIGLMLLLTAFIRSFDRSKKFLSRFILKYHFVYLVFMGFIHGLSNMGGAFLTIFVSSLYKEKRDIRLNISLFYLMMALVQLLTLGILRPHEFHLKMLLLIPISAMTFQIAGNRLFLRLPEFLFSKLITLFIFAYGIILTLK